MKILIWGTKTLAKYLIENLKEDIKIVGLIDNDKNRQGMTINNYPVFSPDKIIGIEHDYILIAATIYANEIVNQLITKLDYPQAKIISFGYFFKQEDILAPITRNTKLLSKFVDIEKIMGRSCLPTDLIITEKNYYKSEYDSVLDDENNIIYQVDYKRYRTFELCAEEILRNNIAGETAEFGVFSGVFAKIINKKFSQKKLYLFDTFEGFPEKDLSSEEKESDTIKFHNSAFSNITLESVLAQMPYPENCLIKKGYFPDTTHDCQDQKYCFVSLDVDLYTPTYNGLEYFYPRLSEGGYIFIHEYNSNLFPECKKAVNDFEKKHGKLKKVPIADFLGTAVIIK